MRLSERECRKRRKKLFLLLFFNWYVKSCEERFEQLHRHAHYVRQATLDFLDEFVAGLLYGIRSGLVPPGAAFYVYDNLLGRHFPWINSCTVTPYQLRAVAEPDNCYAGYYLVGRAEEFSGNLLGLFGVGGLADNPALEIHDSIGADDN